MKNICSWLAASVYAAGVVGASLVFSGCGAGPEDTADAPWELLDFGAPVPPAAPAGDFGTASEALVSSSSVLPQFYGQYMLGTAVLQSEGWVSSGAGDFRTYCPDTILTRSSTCTFPTTKTFTVHDGFNVAVAPETHVNFHLRLQDAVTYLRSHGLPGIQISSGNGYLVKFGSLPANYLAGTTLAPVLGSCPSSGVQGRGTGNFCSHDPARSSTVFDDHNLAVSMSSVTDPTSRDNLVYNSILHEIAAHVVALGHSPGNVTGSYPDVSGVNIGLRAGLTTNQVSELTSYVP